MMISKENNLYRLIYLFKILDKILQRQITLMYQLQILIHIRIGDSHLVHILLKIVVLFPISAMILHGNSHDIQILISSTALKTFDNFIIQFLVCDILPHQLILIKILQEVHFIISHIRIYLIPTPTCLIIRMHSNCRITFIFQSRNESRWFLADILLIYNRTLRQKCHRIS